MKVPLNPPNTALVDGRGNVTPEWYRFFAQSKSLTDAQTEAAVLTVGTGQTAYPNSRQFGVVPGELETADSPPDFTIGLADSGVAAGSYGGVTMTIAVTVDAKGRVTAVTASALNTTNITEGAKLFYTDTRARAAVSAGTGLSYSSGTGVFSLPTVTIALGGTGATTADLARVNLFASLPIFADNAAATAGGLAVGYLYRTATGQLMIRY